MHVAIKVMEELLYDYNNGDRGARAFQELKELFAGNGMVGFVMKERVDGKLVLKEI